MRYIIALGGERPHSALSRKEALAYVKPRVVHEAPPRIRLVDDQLHRRVRIRGRDVSWEPIWQELWTATMRPTHPDLRDQLMTYIADRKGLDTWFSEYRDRFTDAHHFKKLARRLAAGERGRANAVPRTLYHGTPWPGFKRFKHNVSRRMTDSEAASLGVWLTTDPEVASFFASKRIRAGALKRGSWPDGSPRLYTQQRMKHGAVYVVTADLKNPKVYTSTPDRDSLELMMDDRDQFAEYIDRPRGRAEPGHWEKRMIAYGSAETNRAFRDSLVRQGHDGILLVDSEYDGIARPGCGPPSDEDRMLYGATHGRCPHDTVIVFDPKQITPWAKRSTSERPGAKGRSARRGPQRWIEVDSDLFRESGCNTTHMGKAARFAEKMRSAGGWGRFPPISGYVQQVFKEDVEEYIEAEEGGYEHELAWSRPLTMRDVDRFYVAVDDGHHRAYAAAKAGIPIRIIPSLTSRAGGWTAEERRAWRAGKWTWV